MHGTACSVIIKQQIESTRKHAPIAQRIRAPASGAGCAGSIPARRTISPAEEPGFRMTMTMRLLLTMR